MSMYSGGQSSTNEISASVTATAAGATAVTATLPNGQVGSPCKVRASGSVSGQVAINLANGQQIILPVNPNAPFTEQAIPASYFPGKMTSVSLTITLDVAGVIRAIVYFKT